MTQVTNHDEQDEIYNSERECSMKKRKFIRKATAESGVAGMRSGEVGSVPDQWASLPVAGKLSRAAQKQRCVSVQNRRRIRIAEQTGGLVQMASQNAFNGRKGTVIVVPSSQKISLANFTTQGRSDAGLKSRTLDHGRCLSKSSKASIVRALDAAK